MKKIPHKKFCGKIVGVLLIILIQSGLHLYAQSGSSRSDKEIIKKMENYAGYFQSWGHLGKIKLDSVSVSDKEKRIGLFFNEVLAYVPIRESYIDSISELIREDIGRKYSKYNLELYANKRRLEEYIPNRFRTRYSKDEARLGKSTGQICKPLITSLDKPVYPKGMQGNQIALWHSHGWYYEARLDRWEWQRARLFGTVEDISPMTYVLPYIAPMLENAGATTFIPRERDTHNREVVVDNDRSTGNSEFIILNGKEKWESSGATGFQGKDSLFGFENPFQLGTSLKIRTNSSDTARIIYLPDVPEDGEYALYISWHGSEKNSDAVPYTVYHAGGKSSFLINQQLGGNTWIYLGTFSFRKGKNMKNGRIEIINNPEDGKTVTADAIRLGGGMGNVARRPGDDYQPMQWSLSGAANASLSGASQLLPAEYSWKTSGKARYMEGSRYFLQYSGAPSSVYSPTEGKNDYNDDYQSRGNWVNYLMGEHAEPAADSALTGLNIPIDLSFAFHTDAGVTPNDSVIGILAIYNTTHGDITYPDGLSRMAARDLSDIIQTQIVDDIRARFDPDWTRRGLWDKAYSEAWRPKVPAMLLELFSHQNLADVKFGLDPRFRFAVSRSVYKGMLRFLSGQYQREYVVQPLAPDHFSLEIAGKNKIRLNWQAVSDPLEPTAIPVRYKVYSRKGDLGFDTGTIVSGTSCEFEIKDGVIYSFKVTALNEGGESFPTEILAACVLDNNKKPVLVVNAFDRICGPKVIESGDFAGVAWWDDAGVPYISDMGQVGNQYEFDRTCAWQDDDNPGWGASYADMEGRVVPGNTFDFTYLHGKSIVNAGYSFVSISNESFEKQTPDPAKFTALDLIFGEQRSTRDFIDPEKKEFMAYTPGIIGSIRRFADSGIPLFISGAYIGTDMVENNDSIAIQFAREYLHYTWRADHADNSGRLGKTDFAPGLFPGSLVFNTGYHPSVYAVEAPDAIEPFGKKAVTLYRYAGNNTSSVVCGEGKCKTIVMGFPFESIPDAQQRDELMKAIICNFEF